MRLLTRRQAAELLGVSLRTLDRLRREGLIPWIDVKAGRGGRGIIRLDHAALERVLRERSLGEGLHERD